MNLIMCMWIQFCVGLFLFKKEHLVWERETVSYAECSGYGTSRPKKARVTQGVVLDHAWEREYEIQSMYRVVLSPRFVPCTAVVKHNFEWGAVIWKPQFKSGCGRELKRVRRWSWSGKKCSWRERKSSPLPCGVYSIPRVSQGKHDNKCNCLDNVAWRLLRLALEEDHC